MTKVWIIIALLIAFALGVTAEDMAAVSDLAALLIGIVS